jgi:hypothetical protein
MLSKEAARLGIRARWIAGFSLVALVGAGWFFAGTARSHLAPAPQRPAPATSAPARTRPVNPAQQSRVAANFANLPLSFEPNQGQTDSQVKFLSRNSQYNLFLTSNEAVFTLPVHSAKDVKAGGRAVNARKASPTSQAVLRMAMLGANAAPQVGGNPQLQGHSNYFHGRDASKWVRDVPQYARVTYRGIYPGVDLTFYGQQRQLEFDFVVKPGASPDTIALGIQGAKRIRTDAAGDLVLTSAAGDVRLHKPVAYQRQGDAKQPVEACFVVKGTEVALAVGEYDRSRELVIDPTVSYSTYKGGAGEDQASSVAVDSAGNAYVTGEAGDNTFPHTAGIFAGGPHDVFLVKLDPTGATQLYSTLFGGSGDDSGNSIALDGNGSVYVAGGTSSLNFPGVLGKFQATLTGTLNAFVAKLDATAGSLTFATYLGGSTSDVAGGIAADSTGQVYVVGQTQSTNFPTHNAFQTAFGGNLDAFVTVLNNTFTSLVYSTYLGGPAADAGTGIALDSGKKIYMTGNTLGSVPVTGGVFQGTSGGGQDAFVAKLDPTLSGTASLIYSTYLGGSGAETADGIAVDPANGFAYVTGSTTSANFPLQGAAYPTIKGTQDAFVTEFDAAATAPLKFSTYLGGSGSEVGVAIALDGSKNVYVTGQTDSTDFPTTSPTQSAAGGGKDAFVSEFSPTGGALVFSTYLGGSGDEDVVSTGVLGGIAVDGANNIVVVGDTKSTNFPTANPLQATNGGGVDAFITKYAPSTSGSTFTVSAGALSSTTVARGSSATSTVTLTSVSGFTGPVMLTCSVAPATSKPPSCTLAPPSVTLSANGNQTATLTISTVKASVVSGVGVSALWLPMPGLLLLAVDFVTNRPTRRKLRRIMLTCMALAGLVFLTSCGSGNGVGGGGGGNPGTTTGNYTVTVNGAGGGTNVPSNALSFTVQ